MKRFSSILLYVICSVSAFAFSKAEADSVARLFELEEVVVESQKSKVENIVSVQLLSGDRLQQLSVHSVADALRYFSGIQIKDYGGVGGIKTVDIRSMGSHHVGVFYDGIEVGNAQNGTVDLGKFSLENIEEISLYNGQKTNLLQPAKDYGSAGTIYIRTRKPVFEKGKNHNLSVGMKAGTFGLANPNILYEQKITDNIHLSANAEYSYATGRYHFNIRKYRPDGNIAWDTTGVRQNGDVQAFRSEVGLFGYLPNGKWHVKGYYYQSERGIPRAIIRNVWTSEQRQWDRNAFVQGSFQYSLTKRWNILVSAKYSNDKMRYLNPDTTMVYIDNTFLQQEAYLSWANDIRIFDWWHLALSGDYIFNTLDANLANFAYPRRHTELAAAATSFNYKWIRAQISVLGTFVQDSERRKLNDNHNVNDNDNHNDNSYKSYKFTPAAYLSYQPLQREELYFRAFYKSIYRMPTFNDLYYTDVGNIHLKPEETVQYDGGVEYSKQFRVESLELRNVGFCIKADGYFNQIKNKIVAVPKGNSQYRWMMMNLGYVEIRGVDVNAGVDLNFTNDVSLSLSGTYTYQKAQDFTNPNDELTYGGQIAYIPWNSASVMTRLGWKDLAINYSFIYAGGRYTGSANIKANYEQPWYTHDISLSYLWKLPVGRLSTAVEINNLFNQQYEVIHNYPMPGINGKIIVRYML